MRDHSKHIELTREEAAAAIVLHSGFTEAGRKPAIELVPIAESFGRVLADDIVSRVTVPDCLTCAMDSIAVHWSDFESLAEGELPDTSKWVRGIDWSFANTGVAMPDGFDTAIVVEHVTVSADEQHVTIDAAPSRQFAGTRPAGSRLAPGDVVARAGQVVTPDLAAAIAAANVTSVPCACRPRVAFIPTGNELVPAGVVPSPDINGRYAAHGKVFETNSILVRGKVEEWGGIYVPFDIVPDEPAEIRAAIERACAAADVVVLNAGSSKGSDDWSCEVMEDMGEMIFHETTHGPGHHSSFAMVEGTPVVGISGPSGGASFTLDFYLRPLVRAFQGLTPELGSVTALLIEDWPAKKGGHGHGSHGHSRTPGEKKEKENTRTGRQFSGIRQLFVEVDADGRLVARPAGMGAGPDCKLVPNAICMISTDLGVEPPKAGALIQIEWH